MVKEGWNSIRHSFIIIHLGPTELIVEKQMQLKSIWNSSWARMFFKVLRAAQNKFKKCGCKSLRVNFDLFWSICFSSPRHSKSIKRTLPVLDHEKVNRPFNSRVGVAFSTLFEFATFLILAGTKNLLIHILLRNERLIVRCLRHLGTYYCTTECWIAMLKIIRWQGKNVAGQMMQPN